MKFYALPLAALPLSGLERRVGLGDVAGLGEEKCHRLFGRGENVRDGGVDDHDAQFRRLDDVDVVETNTGAANDDHVARRLQRRRVDFGGRTDDQRVRAGHGFEELRGRESETDVDLVARVTQLLQTGVGDLFGY